MNKLVVGLTGGIGSGKTTVAHLFSELGVPVIHADQIARQLTEPHTPLYEKILRHVGPTFLKDTQELDRAKLRAYIFDHPKEKQWLEAVLHPPIRARIAEKIKAAEGPYVIVEIPLLLENWPYPNIDRILLVDAEEHHQIERVHQRDHISPEKIQQIMAHQLSRVERKNLAHDIIHNHGAVLDLKNQVNTLHQKYLCFNNLLKLN